MKLQVRYTVNENTNKIYGKGLTGAVGSAAEPDPHHFGTLYPDPAFPHQCEAGSGSGSYDPS
jgi:hypothetical protein